MNPEGSVRNSCKSCFIFAC